MYKCQSPILIIAFNRPDYLQQTFDRVRQVQPSKLYFAVDGPREHRPEDKEAIEQVRTFVDNVDWECDVHTLFREENLGCGYGPAKAISWAFETEDKLIILEDDCVADPSFFQFCDELLERYEFDTRVWLISGRSHQQGSQFFEKQDYIFSRYAHTWGWATWKRCWAEFDINVPDYKDYLEIGGAYNVLATEEQGRFYNDLYSRFLDNIEEEVTHSWDSQWVYTRFKNSGLGIVPKVNLIHNIGVAGTHSSTSNPFLEKESFSIKFPLRHPKFVIPIRNYEILHFNNHIKGINGSKWSCFKRTVARKFPLIKSIYKFIVG